MKKLTKIFAGVALGVLALAAASCTDREQASYGEGTPLPDATITVANAEYNSLTFKWQPVTGAVEYSYKLTDVDGNMIDGGLTKLDSVQFEDLTYSTKYIFHLYAYPAVIGEKIASKENTLAVTTPFWSAVNASGTYYSKVITTGVTSWTASLIEERENDDTYGTFTLQGWYNHTGYDLQFTVNSDSTINVLNGTRDTTKFVKVLAGPSTIKTNIYVRSGVLIDESQCRFDRTNQILRIYARSTRDATHEGLDSLVWE